MDKLEKEQKESVERVLSKIFLLVNAKDGSGSKEAIFDLVINLKLVATESKHPKAGYYSAVLKALRGKLDVPDDRFCNYIKCLLGDRDQEKVKDILAKVDKACSSSSPAASRGRGRPRPYPVRCYFCQGVGHYQRNCFKRQRGGQRGGRGGYASPQ